jgi:hypothetical protein
MPTENIEVAIRPVGLPATVQAIVDSSPCPRDTRYYAGVYCLSPRAYVESAIGCDERTAAELRTATARGVNPHRSEADNISDAIAFEFRAAAGRAELADRDAWLAANPGGYAGT